MTDIAKLRDRVFTLKEFAPKIDEDGNLVDSSVASKPNQAFPSTATLGTKTSKPLDSETGLMANASGSNFVPSSVAFDASLGYDKSINGTPSPNRASEKAEERTSYP